MNNTVEKIQLMLSSDDADEAKFIYNQYKEYLLVRTGILDVMARALSLDKKIESSLLENIATHDIDKVNDSDVAAVEALALYSISNRVDTTISLEALSEDITARYKKEHNLISPHHIDYYLDSNGIISHIPNERAVEIGLECILDGRLNGISGGEYFTNLSMDYSLSQETEEQFAKIFSLEDKLVKKSGVNLLIASLEKFFTKDYVVAQKVTSCPQCDPKKFKSLIKEADVLVIYRKPKYIGIGGVILNKINSKVTGSSFMSIKLVGPEGKSVIGYGAYIGAAGAREVPIDYFIETCSGIIAIRHKDMNDTYRKKITDHARIIIRMNPKYDYINIIKTMFTHKGEEEKGAEKILSKVEANNYYAPMICTTLVTSSYRAAGIDPGVEFSDKSAWPIDVLRSSKFKSVCTYFDEKQQMNMYSAQSFKPINKKFDKAVQNEVNLYVASTEEFFSHKKEIRDIVKNVKKVSVKEFKAIAKEGDAITVTRIGGDSIKSWINKHIMQGQSFTSLKMIGPNCDTVIGFGVKLIEDGGTQISEIPWDEFASTCRAIVLIRPKQITDKQRHDAYRYMRNMQARDIDYMSVGANFASCIRHIFQYGKKDKTPLTKDELKYYKKSLLCSSLVANAWRVAGIDNGFHTTAERDVWPRDFLLNPLVEFPCAYFVPGELPEYYTSI